MYRSIAAWCAVLVVLAIAPSRACTCFRVEREEKLLVGRNYDWDFSDGLVLVNPRGLEKPFEIEAEGGGETWTSSFGSVTFNQYGRDFPNGGMNERGLVVEVLWLNGAIYPPVDERPALDTVQWIQYQLDTASTVDQVAASLDRVRVQGSASVHFFVADATGAAAAVEFLGGAAVVHRSDDSTAVPVLANHSYAESEEYLRACQGWGGDRPLDRSTRSLARFARAATGVRELAQGPRPLDSAAIFRLLSDVSQGDLTQWSIVYDLNRRRIEFHTVKNPDVRVIELSAIDFSCLQPARMMNVDGPEAGDAAAAWIPYRLEANRDLVARTYRLTDFLRDVTKKERERIVTYPERARCVE